MSMSQRAYFEEGSFYFQSQKMKSWRSLIWRHDVEQFGMEGSKLWRKVFGVNFENFGKGWSSSDNFLKMMKIKLITPPRRFNRLEGSSLALIKNRKRQHRNSIYSQQLGHRLSCFTNLLKSGAIFNQIFIGLHETQ